MVLHLYLLERTEDAPPADYEEFEGAVVAAYSAAAARKMHPRASPDKIRCGWVPPEQVKLTRLGLADPRHVREPQVILAANRGA